ncbi:MAG: hypothetical protein DRP11_00345 [Candidatus Aenigmatarchaeota archaeon]|nr:MAG: hypothetical protein DRP11_00345 [Candidatus Aenigmarchaeota archaeon]
MLMEKKLPLVPFPMEKTRKIAHRFLGIGSILAKMRPGLKKDLFQSKIDIDPVEYMSIVFFVSLFYSLLIGSTVTFLGLVVRGRIDIIGPIVGLTFFLIPFYYLSLYPKVTAKKRIKTLEKNLLFALRHILIEVRSGVPLYNALVGVSEGYEELSEEFKLIVKDIAGGKKQIEALDKGAERNPSLFFRRALWQLSNALRAGSDIGDTLEAITNDFAQRQANEIRRYGQELNPWTMIYMIVAVIIPSLGITFMIILTTFSGIQIPDFTFPLILLGLGLFQFFFMGFIKTKRPAISV